MTRALILAASLLALAACSTNKHLLAPDPEAAKIISPEPRPDQERGGVDPVCGTPVWGVDDVWISTYNGVEFTFHSEACRKQFEENPELYSATVR